MYRFRFFNIRTPYLLLGIFCFAKTVALSLGLRFATTQLTGISYNKNSATAPPLHFVRGKINSISLHLFLFLLLRNFVAQPLATLGVTNNCYTTYYSGTIFLFFDK